MSLEINRKFRERIGRRDALLMPGAANALAARVIEDLGFEAVYLSGAGLTNTFLGLPDLGFVSLTEIALHTAAIRDAVKEYADALMVVSEPFSVAYGLSALNNAMIIDIGAGTVDFCVMHGTMPAEEDQRTLTTAGDFVDRQLFNLLTERYPQAKFSETMVRHLKEQHGFVGEPENRVKVKVPVQGKLTEHDLTDEIRQSCESILPPIVETMIDLIARYEPEFQEQVKKNIYVAGGGSQIRGITTAIEDAMAEYGSFKVTSVSDPLFAGADGALALAQDMPDEYWEDM